MKVEASVIVGANINAIPKSEISPLPKKKIDKPKMITETFKSTIVIIDFFKDVCKESNTEFLFAKSFLTLSINKDIEKTEIITEINNPKTAGIEKFIPNNTNKDADNPNELIVENAPKSPGILYKTETIIATIKSIIPDAKNVASYEDIVVTLFSRNGC